MLDDLLSAALDGLASGSMRRNPKSPGGAARRLRHYQAGRRVLVPVTLLVGPLDFEPAKVRRRIFEIAVVKGQPRRTMFGWWDSGQLGDRVLTLRSLELSQRDEGGLVTCTGQSISGNRVSLLLQEDDWEILRDAFSASP